LKAFVLAGGKGTRLRPLTYTKPKPLLPLAGEPAIAHLIRKLSREGIDEIVVTTNYFARHLRVALGDGSKYGVRIHHVEEKIPLGTAGSVKNSESLIDETFAVVQGDNQFEFNLNDVVRVHRKLGALATLALVEVDDPSEYGIAELSDGRVTRFLEKPKREERFSNLINTGLYIIEPEVLNLIPVGEMFDFSKNLFPLMLDSKMTLAGFHASGFWVDIGDPESYLKANTWALDKLVRRQGKAKEEFVQEPGSLISEESKLKSPVFLGKNVRIRPGATIGPYACIGDGTEVSANATIERSVIYENTQIGTTSVLSACVVAENCRIGDHVRIERNAVVGAATELRDNVRVTTESKVGPWSTVERSATVQGTIQPFENHLDGISEIIERSSVDLRLSNEEARVCWALCKLDKADAKGIGRLAGIAGPRIDSVLYGLQERMIVTSFGDAPKMFALAPAEQ